MNSSIKQQSGMVIVLAILIIAAVLSSAILFGDFIVREIQQSRLIDDSIQAYYSAESGLEQSLYQLRKREAVVNCTVVDPVSLCDEGTGLCSGSQVPCITTTQGNLQVKSAWVVTVENETELAVPLGPGQSFQVDLFDPADIASSDINRIEIGLLDEGGPVSNLDVLLELTNLTKVFAIADPLLTNCSLQQPVAKTRLTGPEPQIVENVDNQNLFNECSYVLKLNWPPDATNDFSVFTLRVFDKFSNPNVPLAIPSRLIVDSAATYGRSFQAVRARTPIRPPLSGIYDFVLFSEESIVK